MTTWDQGDLYTRISDPAGKAAPRVQHNVAWNMGALLASLQSQYNSEKLKPEDRRIVERVSRHDYEVHKGYKKFSKDVSRKGA